MSMIVDRPTLGILDLSDGPSGLSRYLEILWPALAERFHLVVFGDPNGPYAALPSKCFVPVPEAVRNPRQPRQEAVGGLAGVAPMPASRRPASGVRAAWQWLAPPPLRWAAGFARSARILSRCLASHPVDLIYTSVCDAEFTVVGARLAGIRRVVGTLHLPPPDGDGWIRNQMARLTARSLTAGIAVSTSICDQWVKFGRVPSGKFTVIPNGVTLPIHCPTPAPRATVLAKYGLPESGQPVFLAAGRLTAQKGFRYLLEAVSRLKSQHPSLLVAIAGEGPLLDELIAQAEVLGVSRNVRFLGLLPDITPLLQVVDGFVLSSISEALPFTLLEAMSHGVPVVATAVGGVPELVRPEETGILCSPSNPDQIAEGIDRLIRSPELASGLGKAGADFVRRSFSAESMSKATVKVLQRVLDANIQHAKVRCWVADNPPVRR